jgi:APA family basic amino acid/polyamine antiporter
LCTSFGCKTYRDKKVVGVFVRFSCAASTSFLEQRWSLTAIEYWSNYRWRYFVPGTGAYYHAGPALAISFIIAGITCVFAAFLCYSEFASILPVEGSAYIYLWTIGEVFALVMGWGVNIRICYGIHDGCRFLFGIFYQNAQNVWYKTPDWLLTSDPTGYEGFNELSSFLIVPLFISLLIKGTSSAAKAK